MISQRPYLSMRAVTDGRVDLNQNVRRHLELCLDCRSCETACPSGVHGRLIEPFRLEMERRSIRNGRRMIGSISTFCLDCSHIPNGFEKHLALQKLPND